jgi:hypothetical protein
MQVMFGAGQMFGTRTDIAGATPTRLGALQDIAIDFSKELKELYGQGQVAIVLAAAKLKITGKAKFALLNGKSLNDLFFGQSVSPGQAATVPAEAASVPAVTPFTVTAANGVSFAADLGVVYAATGLPLVRVASGPTLGQYAVSGAGLYSFAAADADAAVLLSYTYGAPGGTSIALTNQLMGTTPLFSLVLTEPFQGRQVNLTLNACVSQKLSFATKIDDFTIPEFDFAARADAAGNVGTLSFAE